MNGKLNVILRMTALILVFVINQNGMAAGDTPVDPLVRTTAHANSSRTRVIPPPRDYQAAMDALGKIDSSGFQHNQAVYSLDYTLTPATFKGAKKIEIKREPGNDQIGKDLDLLESMKERRQELSNCPAGESEKIEAELLDGIVKEIHASFTDSPQESVPGKPQKFIEARYLALVNTYRAFIKDAKDAGMSVPLHEKIENGLKEFMTQVFGANHEADYDLAKAETVKDPATGHLTDEAKKDSETFKKAALAKTAIAAVKSGGKKICQGAAAVKMEDKKDKEEVGEEEEEKEEVLKPEEKKVPAKADVRGAFLPPTEKPKEGAPATKPPVGGTNGTGTGGPGNGTGLGQVDGGSVTPPPIDPLDPRDFNQPGFEEGLNDDPLDQVLRNLREAGNRTGGTNTGPSFSMPPFTPPQSNKGDTTPQTPQYPQQQPQQPPPSALNTERPEDKASSPDWSALYPKDREPVPPREAVVPEANPKDQAKSDMQMFQTLLALLNSNRNNNQNSGVLNNGQRLTGAGGNGQSARGVSNGPRVAKTSGRKYVPKLGAKSNPYAMRNFRGTGTGMQQNGNGDSPRVPTN
jgi:hypothetical protein